MTPKTKMIEFMRKKAAVIEAACDGEIKFLSEADIKDLESWPEEVCEDFLAGFAEAGADVDICPWCFRYLGPSARPLQYCRGCGYKRRHGDCLGDLGDPADSTYGQVTRCLYKKLSWPSFSQGFFRVPGIAELVNEYKEKKS